MEGTPFGRYRLVEVLGQGGMGQVWRAYDSATKREVAVKLLPRALAGDPTYVARFQREAEAAASLNDPHIVPIHTYGEIDDQLFVEMPIIEGRDLASVLVDGPLAPARAVHVIEQIASALDAAHRIGLVHRDVKPSNILLTATDFAYLIDFGIARSATGSGLTSTGEIMGTSAYMAPERIRSNTVDARSDVYALTCVLHQCLTGHQPYPGDTFEQLAAAHLWVPPPRPSEIHPTVPHQLDTVITVGMAKAPEARYPNAPEMARAARAALNPATQAATLIPEATEFFDVFGEDSAGGSDVVSFPWPPADDPDRAPYRGWQPFDPVDAGIFFGRETPIARAVEAVGAMAEAKTKTWFIVLGPSGAGKSCFLRAGVLPRLQRADDYLVLPIVRPARNVIDGSTGLAKAIHTARQRMSLTTPTLGDIKTFCTEDPARVRALLAEVQIAARARRSDDAALPTLVLPLDQAEELLAADAGPQAQAFFELISALAAPVDGQRLEFIVAATIRSDRFETFQMRPELAEVGTELFGELKPMPPEQFRDVIAGPAARCTASGRPLAVAPELVQRLLADCREGADTLPLLSLTLARLYEDYGDSETLTLAHYEQLGGLKRVVQTEIDNILSHDESERRDQLARLRSAFIPWLATFSADTDQPMRRVARYDDLPTESRPLIDALVARRLLTTDVRDGHAVVEVALESLLRQWDQLVEWLRTERASLKTADDLERTSGAWESSGRDASWLLTGNRLTEAEMLVNTPGFAERLSGTRLFMTTSRQAENERLAKEEDQRETELRIAQERQATAEAHSATLRQHATTLRKRSRVLWVALAVAVVAALVAVIGFVSANGAKNEANGAKNDAERRARQATALSLVGESQAILAGTRNGNDVDAFQRLLAAWAIDADVAAGGLYNATVKVAETRRVFEVPEEVRELAFSNDGHWIAARDDKGVSVWQAEKGTPGPHKDDDRGYNTKLVFSPDGTLLASPYRAGLLVWKTESGAPARVIEGTGEDISALAFDSVGDRVVTADESGQLQLWDTQLMRPIGAPVPSHQNRITAVGFGSGPAPVVSMARDGSVMSWDGELRAVRTVLPATELQALGDITPDLTRMAIAKAEDRFNVTVRVIDTNDGREVGPPIFASAPDYLSAMRLSPSARQLVTGSTTGSLTMWDIATGRVVGDQRPIGGSVRDIQFSADGRSFATLTENNGGRSVRVWDANFGPVDTGNEDRVFGVAFTSGDDRLVAVSHKGLHEWDVATRTMTNRYCPNVEASNKNITFSRDGTRVVTDGYVNERDGARVWDTGTCQPVGPELLPSDGSQFFSEMTLSPDGNKAAIATRKALQIWDAATGQSIGTHPLSKEPEALAFSNDGRLIATGDGDGAIEFFSADDATRVGEPVHVDDAYIDSLAFNPDDTQIAVGDQDGDLQVFDLQMRKPIGPAVRGHSDKVYDISYSADGKRFASVGGGRARLWDATTGQPIGEDFRANADLHSLAFSADGRSLAAGASNNAIVRFLPAAPEPELLCNKISENMSKDQWKELVPKEIGYAKACQKLPPN